MEIMNLFQKITIVVFAIVLIFILMSDGGITKTNNKVEIKEKCEKICSEQLVSKRYQCTNACYEWEIK